MSIRTRASWTLTDQALSSLSNLGLTVAAARTLSAHAVGAVTLAFYSYTIMLGISYALSGEPFQVLFSDDRSAVRCMHSRRSALAIRLQDSAVLSVAVAIGLISGISMAIVALIGHLSTPSAFIAMGVALPGLLLQDTIRQIFFALGHPRSAALNDSLWIVISGAAFVTWTLLHERWTPAAVVTAWACGAWAASIVGLGQLGAPSGLARMRHWLATTRSLGLSFCADFLSMTGAGMAVYFVLPAVVDLTALGGVRGSQLLFAPLGVLYGGSRAFGVPEGVRLKSRGVEVLRRAAAVYGGALIATGLLYGLIVLLVPYFVWRPVLGSIWTVTRPLLLLGACVGISRAIAIAPYQGLRVIGAGQRILRARLADATLTIVLSILGAVLLGTKGALAGIALANLLASGFWWYHYLAGLNDTPPDFPHLSRSRYQSTQDSSEQRGEHS